MQRVHSLFILLLLSVTALFSLNSFAQSVGGAGTIHGVVMDPTGGVIPGAAVEIHNPVTGYRQAATTDASGEFRLVNVPQNPYHISISKDGFQTWQQDISIRSSVAVELKPTLQLSSERTTVTVEASSADLLENVSSAHTDVDRSLAERLPVETPAAALSAIITLASPGVVADSNGLFHPLGEHADTTFVVDNQPISDQQSKFYSNQIPLEAVDSLEVISGAPPAEYGDKTSLTARVVTRSGQGLARPTGTIGAQYGSFGAVAGRASLGVGGKRWGTFLAVNGVNTGRFLDPPDTDIFHAKGNSQAAFERLDIQPGTKDSLHLNFFFGRSWFQTPNTFDQQLVRQDQRELINSWNISPGWTHTFGPTTLLAVSSYVRQDRVHYFPSADPFSDTPATVAQTRRLTNAGAKADLSYVRGRHNAKFGVQIYHTFLTEDFSLGVTDPGFNSPCVDSQSNPVPDPSLRSPSQCVARGFALNDMFVPGLIPFDLSRAGSLFRFFGHTDVKQEAFYAQDTISLGPLSLNGGLRVDNYDGISHEHLVEPRAGASYLIKRSGTVLRLSYARLFETPYNENLVLSSAAGAGGLAANAFGANGAIPLQPGRRNQFNAGLQQALGRHLVVDADYFWKYTRTAFDFDTLFNTPIVFPIEWRKSKIDGVGVRVNFT